MSGMQNELNRRKFSKFRSRLQGDGSAVAWGSPFAGGDTSEAPKNRSDGPDGTGSCSH